MEADKIGTRPFLISLAGLNLAELLGMAAGRWFPLPPMLITGAVRLTEIGFFLFVFAKWGKGLADMGLAKEQIIPGLKRGMLWSAGFGIVVMIGFGILFLWGHNPFRLIHARIPQGLGDLFSFLLVAGLIGPVAEEIFFRGILYGFLRRWGVFLALAVSSLTFLLLHDRGGFTQAVGGLLFALAYETEGRLMVPIAIHVLGNMAIFGISIVF